ncbi:type II secretion system protein GspL [Thorsellia anophelis]|uniref:Type II secretion system (T2SS), protein L n=1 Tax=Thorsellia anophelis DSM 18579 TaxID=1123402 RepID=A0A1I0AW34_9GAMM|nr:type II secretion system protein GspL [Thorsellia anophelis]SES98198.1 Type II secretion system (T2SS), protein L [Thorsellia anophelis DSM 18579]
MIKLKSTFNKRENKHSFKHNQTLIVYELPYLLNEFMIENEQENLPKYQYWLCDAQKVIMHTGLLTHLNELTQLGMNLQNIDVYCIIANHHVYIHTLTIPGKLTPALIESLKFQVEHDLASEVNHLRTILLNKNANDVTFALIDEARLEHTLSTFSNLNIKLLGVFIDAMVLPISQDQISVFIDSQTQSTLWRFSQFDYSMLPVSTLNHVLPEKLQALSDNHAGGLNTDEEFTDTLQVYYAAPTAMGYLEEQVLPLLSTFKLKQIHPPKLITIPGLFFDWLSNQNPKQLRHHNLLPLIYQRGQKKRGSIFASPFWGLGGAVICLGLIYLVMALAIRNQQLDMKTQSVIRMHNQVFNQKFKTLGEVSQDLKQRQKTLEFGEAPKQSLFDWYQYLPAIFDEGLTNSGHMVVTQMHFFREKNELRIGIEVDSHQRLNQIKMKAAQYFTLIESQATERNSKIETTLILKSIEVNEE